MKTYFINLDRSPDRLDYMTRTLDGLGLDHERIAAVDGRSLTEEEIAKAYRVPPGNTPLDRGTIACFLSHRRVWQRIAEGSEPFALVLEDDILFGGNAKAILDDASWIPADSQIIKLETFGRYTICDRRPVTSVAGRNLVRLRHIHLGGGAYILSRTAASTLLGQTAPFGFSVDNVLFDPDCPEFCGLETLQMVPAPCVQAAMAPKQLRTVTLPSTLQGTRRRKFAKGLKRLGQKAAREIAKRRLVIRGLLFDRLRGFKTARIPFQ